MLLKINNPTDYKVAMYIRLSKEDEDKKEESQSVTNQRSLIINFIKENNLNLIDTYIDDGVSGTTFDRPQFNRMIEDINSKRINMVVTKDLSRLGRDYIQTGYYLEKFFPENRIRYISLLDGIDTGVDISTNDITPFKAIMNDMYAKDISKKITSVKRDKQRKGLFIGGKPAYGYKKHPTEKNKIIIDEEVAPNVRRAFKLALEGNSGRRIARIFTDENIPTPGEYANAIYRVTPTTHFWKSEFIQTMLRNEVYIGNMVQGRKRKVSYKSKKEITMPKDEWVIVPNTHEPIIDKKDFYDVQMLLDKRKPTRTRTHEYLLKGLVYCHECGYLMGVGNRHLASVGDTLYFRCRTHIRNTKYSKCSCHSMREDLINNIVIDTIREICKKYLDKDKMKKAYKEVKDNNDTMMDNKTRIEELISKLSIINSNLDKVYNDRLSGLLDEKDFEKIYKIKKTERDSIQKEIDLLTNISNNNQTNLVDEGKELKKLLKKFLNMKKPDKLLVFTLIDRVEIAKEAGIIVKFKFRVLNETQDLHVS